MSNKENLPEDPNKIETIPVWALTTNRLFERYVFFYCCIMFVFIFIGMATFGFRVPNFSDKGSLFFNFLWFIVLSVLIWKTPVIYHLFLGRFFLSTKQKAEVEANLSQIKNSKNYSLMYHYYEINGSLAPNKYQNRSLAIIFCTILYEIFFLTSWVRGSDRHLVWTPDWAMGIISFIRRHLDLPPLNIDRDLFLFEIPMDSILHKLYPNEQVLLTTPLADSGLLFFAYTMIVEIPLLICVGIILWNAIDWLGLTKINPKNIHGIGSFLWSSLASLIMLFVMIAVLWMFSSPISYALPSVLSISYWLDGTPLYIMGLANVVVAIKLILGWFGFWRKVFNCIKKIFV